MLQSIYDQMTDFYNSMLLSLVIVGTGNMFILNF